jgi:hypothetical protein
MYLLLASLVDDPRHNLEAWSENVETHARNMCSAHDIMSARTLVLSDDTWESVPANLTNPIDVAAGQPAVYRNRPDYDMPADHAANVASGVVMLNADDEVQRFQLRQQHSHPRSLGQRRRGHLSLTPC